MALANSANQPDHKITVFAGQDREATERARSYFEGNPPSSPAVAILRDGKLVYLMQRFVIEQSTAQQIAGELVAPSTSSAPRHRRKTSILRSQRKTASRMGGRFCYSCNCVARSVTLCAIWQLPAPCCA